LRPSSLPGGSGDPDRIFTVAATIFGYNRSRAGVVVEGATVTSFVTEHPPWSSSVSFSASSASAAAAQPTIVTRAQWGADESLRKGIVAPTEEEFAIALDFEMRRRGADGIAFESIVASGPNGALPHARPSGRRIDDGELVVVDFGAIVDGYRSDMTRTVSVGAPRPDELRELLEAVMVAQRAGIRTVRAGVTGGEVDAACRESLASVGLAQAFLHGTGHGVGLEVHEAPSVSQDSPDILEEGAVVTVEPGAYLYSTGGARIEDTLVVTATGARLLTKSTKDYVL